MRSAKWRRVAVAFVAVAVVAAGGAGTVRWYAGAGEPVLRMQPASAAATVAIERTDLGTDRTVQGTLGFGPPRTIKAPGGTVTWLPPVGVTVKRGEALYRNNDHPVIVLYGRTPLFRKLDSPELTGRDVRVVVDNLRALGYRVGDQPERTRNLTMRPGDGMLTTTVIEAIKTWQRDAGLPVTGAIDPVDVAVLPGPARVDRLTAQIGDEATGGVLAVTGRTKVVSVPVRADELDGIQTGVTVRMTLPCGKTTPGKVTRIDADARIPGASEDSEPSQAEVNVTVTLKDAGSVKKLNTAPVQISFTGETRKGVLAVPVAALLALREGGHAVQVAGGPVVAVDTGMFAMGMVEIRGDGLTEGTRVVTAS